MVGRYLTRTRAEARVMLITVCRLYDSRPDAHRVIVALEIAGVPGSDTSVNLQQLRYLVSSPADR
jgi:hypothetical protein